MKRFSLAFCTVLLVITGIVLAADPTLPDLFKRAKDKFSGGDYRGSLADFDLLDTNSAKPGFENDRAKLIPVITFYRGANLAALGRRAEAKDAFIAYLGYIPNASIASPPFPKATVAVFDEARQASAKQVNTLNGTYATFVKPAGWKLEADEHWIESPVFHLLTPAQKKEYATFTTNAERAAFVEAFWKQLDPTPATDINEFRDEFERRTAFADAMFTADKPAGRYSDRASVFVFLGPPTYAAMSNIGTSDDAMSALRANGNGDIGAAMHSSASTSTVSMNAIAGRQQQDRLDQDYNRGARESWVYRQDRLPKGATFKEVRFDFLTRPGYGSGVLQKESTQMLALGQAIEAARAEKTLR